MTRVIFFIKIKVISINLTDNNYIMTYYRKKHIFVV